MSNLPQTHQSKPRKLLSSKLGALKDSVVKAIVPPPMRRAIFSASLAALLKGITTPDKELAKQVGAVMELPYNTDSLLYPMQISGWIWKEVDKNKIDLSGAKPFTAEELHDFCTNIITNTPKSLYYNTRRAMREDVYRLVMAFAPSSGRRMSAA